MTNREAIEWLRRSAMMISDVVRYNELVQILESFDIGIQALEKQEPKKVDDNGEFLICDCNNCIDLILGKPKYCDNCGQASDWSE